MNTRLDSFTFNNLSYLWFLKRIFLQNSKSWIQQSNSSNIWNVFPKNLNLNSHNRSTSHAIQIKVMISSLLIGPNNPIFKLKWIWIKRNITNLKTLSYTKCLKIITSSQRTSIKLQWFRSIICNTFSIINTTSLFIWSSDISEYNWTSYSSPTWCTISNTFSWTKSSRWINKITTCTNLSS